MGFYTTPKINYAYITNDYSNIVLQFDNINNNKAYINFNTSYAKYLENSNSVLANKIKKLGELGIKPQIEDYMNVIIESLTYTLNEYVKLIEPNDNSKKTKKVKK